MNNIVRKVTAFIIQQRGDTRCLLLFRHPTAGIQVPAGTIENGEAPADAAVREAREETGLQDVQVERYLGCRENELRAGECILAQTTPVYLERNVRSMPYQRQLRRGVTVQLNSREDAFANITYIEYDQFPDPRCIVLNITGWVPAACVAMRKERHFFLLSCHDETANDWSLPADEGHTFHPFWARVDALPPIVEPQAQWLRYLPV